MKIQLKMNLVVDGQLLPEDVVCKLLEKTGKTGPGTETVFEANGLRLTGKVLMDGQMIKVSVRLQVLSGSRRRLTEVRFKVPDFCIGDPAACRLHLPGENYPPDWPYLEAARIKLDTRVSEPLPSFPSGWCYAAPDQGTGMVAVENYKTNETVSVWFHSEHSTTFPTINGDGHYVTVELRHLRPMWLDSGTDITIEGFRMLFTHSGIEAHLAEFREAVYGQKPCHSGWMNNARLFQINPYPLRIWQDRLEEISKMGFNLLYLMPVWHFQSKSYYALINHYKIDERVGTIQELKTFVAQAHQLGFKVLFDFIPQGIGVLSPFRQTHAGWLSRDEQNRPFGSHSWGPRAGEPAVSGTFSMDWGNPEYRRFCLDWALWNVKEFDIDGFRCDAMNWKEPNFGPDNQRPAWETLYGGVRLAEQLRAEMQKLKPETLMLGEIWGPVFRNSCDAVYADIWLLNRVNSGWLSGQPVMTARQWMRWLALNAAARPAGFIQAFFTANHDLLPVARQALTSPMANAVSFMHAFTPGIPFVTGSETPGREKFFGDLITARAKLSGYTGEHSRTASDVASLFTILWMRNDEAPALAAANLSMDSVESNVTLGFTPAKTEIIFSSRDAGAAPCRDGVSLKVPAGGYVLLKCR